MMMMMMILEKDLGSKGNHISDLWTYRAAFAHGGVGYQASRVSGPQPMRYLLCNLMDIQNHQTR